MSYNDILSSFRNEVCDSIYLRKISDIKYQVVTPFRFDDGDHFKIFLQRDNDHWILTDNGHTLMHLCYYIDENQFWMGKREKIILETLEEHSLNYDNGKITKPLYNFKDQQFPFGSSLFSLLQGLVQIYDVLYISKEGKSPFVEDVDSFMSSTINTKFYKKDWNHPEIDQKREYLVDYCINGLINPVFVFVIRSDYKVMTTAITLYEYEKLALKNRSVAIYEDIDEIGIKNHNKLKKVCNTEFPNFYEQKDEISEYFVNELPKHYLIASSY